jgi:aspartyl-tRNA(Asn)/glutamyl-tRNA(Gln) amidotransferase subunit A
VIYLTIDDLVGKNVIEDSIKRIYERDKEINSVLRIEKVEGNKDGNYFGIPFLVKDNILVEGTKTTNGSKILENYSSPYTATAVEKLLKAGFTVVGKTNMDEFAMGNTNEHSAFGPVKNPKDLKRVPGGSSGGSAAAVAAGYVPFSLGSDTGGSVRQPAAFCGVVGFKPSYGMISRYGLTAFSSSLDQIGVFANNVKDVRTVTEIMKGKDPKDSTTLEHDKDLVKNVDIDLSQTKICIPKVVYHENADDNVIKQFERVINFLRSKGAKVDIKDIPELEYSVAIYYIIAPAEASSNLSRYDGVKYGLRNHALGLNKMYKATREGGLGIEVKRRIMMGTFNLSSLYYDQYYSKASKVRKLLSNKMKEILNDYHLIMTPTSPVLPPKIGEKLKPLDYYLMDIFTIPANLTGSPAISIPFGDVQGLPFGIQFIGRYMKDEELLTIADNFFKETPRELKNYV